jgi:peroxiredoxin Q/BCP
MLGALLRAGVKAPEFEALDQAGGKVRLADHRGRHVVLVFYPGDDTPG